MTQTQTPAPLPHLDPSKRQDVLYLLSVHHSNLNGDPDMQNAPRTNPVTGKGFATGESLKRKLRDYVSVASVDLPPEAQARLKIQIAHGAVLSLVTAGVYQALGIAYGDAQGFSEDEIEQLLDLGLPEAFTVEDGEVSYNGSLKKAQLSAALAELRTQGVDEATLEKLNQVTQARKVSASERVANEKKVIPQMQATYWDARMFGYVAPGQQVSAGKTRGPWQVSNLESLAPITLLELAITRVARAKSDDKEGSQIGRRWTVPQATYQGGLFYSPVLGQSSGVTEQDMALMYEGLRLGYDLSRSSARPDVRVEGIFVFTHDSRYGVAPHHKLFESLKLSPDGDGYTIDRNPQNLPAGITLTVL